MQINKISQLDSPLDLRHNKKAGWTDFLLSAVYWVKNEGTGIEDTHLDFPVQRIFKL